MSGHPVLSDLDLAALLCSRVCHDVISPVGAIANGLEVLEDEDDEDMKKVAMDLVRRSARQASAKLQFCRIAFGAAGSAGASLDLGEAGDTAKSFVGDEKVKLDWQAPRQTRPKTEVKLLLNMMLLAIAAVPRGGTVTVSLESDMPVVSASGDAARLPEKIGQLLKGQFEAADL
ncbi:MAG TPA: histidine phosphotransferase family protein, partial [Aestuariivirgaceae bacterium]|nr:histidine phosphotransferase family protein [Aestuariivirgaceae bacterium]